MNRFKAISSALLFVHALAVVSAQARAEFKCNSPTARYRSHGVRKGQRKSERAASVHPAHTDDPEPAVLGLCGRRASARLGAKRIEKCSGEESTRSSGQLCRNTTVRNDDMALARQLNAAHFMREALKIRSELRVFTLEKMGQPIEESVAL